jgi:hypothetical protein
MRTGADFFHVFSIPADECFFQVLFFQPVMLFKSKVYGESFGQKYVGYHAAGIPGIPTFGKSIVDFFVLGEQIAGGRGFASAGKQV